MYSYSRKCVLAYKPPQRLRHAAECVCLKCVCVYACVCVCDFCASQSERKHFQM